MAVIVEVVARTEPAEARIDALKNSLVGVKNAAGQAGGNDGIGSLVKNGGAMGILNDLTGGLAMNFKDAYESIQLSNGGLKGMKAAIAATGIGLLVVAVGAIAANWDEIVGYIQRANSDLEVHKQIADGIRATTKRQYEDYVAIENVLRLQGLSEDEILEKRTQLLQIDIEALKFQMAMNQILLARLEIQDMEVKQQVEKLGLFGKVMGIAFEENEQIKETKKAIIEQGSELKRLEGTYAGLQITKTDREKTAEEKRLAILKEGRKKEAEELEQDQKLADEKEAARLKSKEEADSEERDARLSREREQRQTELDIMFLEEEALTKKKAEEADKQKKSDEATELARRNLTSNTFAFLQTIAEIYGKGNEKRARAAFKITKALSLAETAANTYKSVMAVLADPTYIGPGRFIAAASVGIAGLTSLAKIASTQFNSSGGGGGGGSLPSLSGGDSGGSPQGQSPQAAIDFSFLQNQQPIQTYVIGSEVKTSNEAEQKIKDQSTL